MTNDTTRAMPTVEEISELADLVDSTCWGEESRHDAAVMLRTIADQMRKNEPVAWMEPNEGGCINALTKREAWASDVYTIPLYTIPLADAEDARRYRWLLSHTESMSGLRFDWYAKGGSNWGEPDMSLQDVIDAAMKEDSHD